MDSECCRAMGLSGGGADHLAHWICVFHSLIENIPHLKPSADQDPPYISSFIIFASLSRICWVLRGIDRTFDTLIETFSLIIFVRFITFSSIEFEIVNLICIYFLYFDAFVSPRVQIVLVWSGPPELNAEYDYSSRSRVGNMG